ncbi:MAG: ABC transporter ATP-binding protein, partial [Chloroflexaceae bacterium]|nr:ABC transporter ATP-binding protein [Chloroflexaceae bacterium]
QRAALLRTVMWKQPMMLLDEPFGALDAITRAQLQRWLLTLWDELDRTVLLVTHDVDEAILLSDYVAVLTARPARVALTLTMDLPRPRTYQMITTPAFARLKEQLLAALGDEL